MTFFDLWGFAADTIGIVLILPAIYMILFGDRIRKWRIQRGLKKTGRISAVLVIGIGARTRGMKDQVKNYIDTLPEFKKEMGELQLDKNLFMIEKMTNMPEPVSEKEKRFCQNAESFLHEVMKELDNMITKMASEGVRTVHLFYQGPAILMGPIGAVLDNRFEVWCYHYSSSTAGYYCVGKLQEPMGDNIG